MAIRVTARGGQRKGSSTKLLKLGDIPVPTVPKQFHGRSFKGGQAAKEPGYQEWVATRNAFAVKCLEAKYSLTDVARILVKAKHNISPTGLRGSLDSHGLVPPEMKRLGVGIKKGKRSEVNAVANLIDELVEERIKPLRVENFRLRGVEKKYNALRAAFRDEIT